MTFIVAYQRKMGMSDTPTRMPAPASIAIAPQAAFHSGLARSKARLRPGLAADTENNAYPSPVG